MSNKSIANIECGCPMNKIIISFLPDFTCERKTISVHEKPVGMGQAMRPECLFKRTGDGELLLTLNSISYEYKSI